MRKPAIQPADTTRDLEHHSRELGLVDPITGLLSAEALRFLGGYQVRLAQRTGRPFALLSVVVATAVESAADGNESDHDVLRETAGLLLATFRSSDVCAYLGENEFAVLLSEVSRVHIGPQIARLRLLELLERQRATGDGRHQIAFRTGVAGFEPETEETFEGLLDRAHRDAKAMSPTAVATRASELAASSTDIRLLAARQ